MASALATTEPEATLIPVAPGNIVHSNDVQPEDMFVEAMKAQQLAGISEAQAKAFVEWSLTYVQSKSVAVAPQQRPPIDVQTLNQNKDTFATEPKNSLPEQQMEEDLLTDDTGEEAEAMRANTQPGDAPHVKKIKKSAKQAKLAKKHLAGGSGSSKK